MLDEKLFKKIIDESSRHLLYLTFYFQGEPYLNKHFLDMVKYASGKKIYTMTSTNGHYFSAATAEETVRSGLQKIIVSVDGVTQESYESYRIGGNLATVIHGARSLVEAKKKLRSSTPYIVLQFIAMKHNENEIDSVRELGLTLQVDEVVIKSAQVYDFQNNQSLIPGNEKLARYKRDKSGNWKIKNSLENHCWKMWHSAVITWDGNVVPCCFDKDAKYVMGSLVNSSLAEVWNNQPYRQFRKQLLKGRSEIDICTNCTEGTKVWM